MLFKIEKKIIRTQDRDRKEDSRYKNPAKVIKLKSDLS